ncbi:TetR family transcriptional regulator [Halopseudomonas oceani]|uniref:TetR family transcriptional regulator n=1 Tax=Halopseudomonas oceani TaxID=1708783 RepID=A0A2P4ES04_9GAMM|nr:TetR family transcriptional regulator [Halopseudomonas oceani]POB01749.1 TetR family transcriptional regulator [Halopseudomonas oceani]GGE55341.1 TetR family transcriptional regulator [Halopseudomonas oceani]
MVASAELKKNADPPGKRALLEAAERLAASSRCVTSLGLRELAREAGLNPNTFYRHFRDMEDLGLQLLRQSKRELRMALRALRRQAAAEVEQGVGEPGVSKGRAVCRQTLRLYFDYVHEHRNRVLIALRELHGPSALLREELQRQMDEFADDMAEDIRELQLIPERVSAAQVRRVAGMVNRNMLFQSLDYLGEPARRSDILALAEEQVMMLFRGAVSLLDQGELRP